MNEAEPLPQRICRLLADGQSHSGATLAAQCAVSRNAVWKAIANLREAGVEIEASAQRGYRRVHAGELLDQARVRALLPQSVAARLHDGQCVWRTQSTNQDLLAREPCPAGSFDFLTAECQTQGRGRRARRWMAPPCGAICLSVSWSFAALPADASALSLAVGVWVLRALRGLQVPGVALKWPNDLVVEQSKLGGILIELRAEASGPAYVVIGIGMNVALGGVVQRQIEATGTRAAELAGLCPEPVDRHRVVAELIARIVQGMEQYPTSGFGAYAAEWRAADALAGKPVVITGDTGRVTGHARGIDIDGALCVQTREGLQRFVSGDVSVRVTP
jgi:BirA family transcriptional regulator, biotin operon repressor / biotin---[acetyl-CoA-carboxylase] ligase